MGANVRPTITHRSDRRAWARSAASCGHNYSPDDSRSYWCGAGGRRLLTLPYVPGVRVLAAEAKSRLGVCGVLVRSALWRRPGPHTPFPMYRCRRGALSAGSNRECLQPSRSPARRLCFLLRASAVLCGRGRCTVPNADH